MDYFPTMNDAEVQMYKQLRRKILADQAEQQSEQREKKINLTVALSELEDDAPVEKPCRKWHGLGMKKGRNFVRENDEQRLRSEEPYSYQGTRGYGKLAARKAQ
jgi:hypothetical protein